MNPYSLIVRPKKFMMDYQKAEVDQADLMKEISSSETDIQRAISPYNQNLDPVIRAKGIKIYRDMKTDDQVKACLALRKHARLSTPWSISSGEEGNSEADMYAEFIKQTLQRMDGTLEQNLYEIYSAIDYGFSISEKVFYLIPDGDFEGKIGLKALKTKEPYYYDFKIDPYGNILGLVYIGPRPGSGYGGLSLDMNPQSPMLGTVQNPYPPDKFVIYSYNREFGSPYGTSDLQSVFNNWISKRMIIKFWNIFLERYAAGFVWAKVDPDAGLKKQALDQLDDFMRNLSARSGFRGPKGIEIALIQPSATASSAYADAVEFHNRSISHGILCPNLTGFTGGQGGGAGPTGGSHALGKKQFDAFVWIIDKMGRDTEEGIMNEQIISTLMTLNFPNVPPSLFPKFKFESIDEANMETRANIISILASQGFVNPDEEWVRAFMTLPKKEPDVVLTKPGVVMPGEDPQGKQTSPNTPTDKSSPAPSKNGNADTDKNTTSNKESDEKPKEFKMRELDSFEKKLKPKQYAESIDTLESQVFEAMTKDLEVIRDRIIDFVDRKGIVESGSAKDLERIPFNTSNLVDTVKRWLVKAHLDSKLKALEELRDGGVNINIVRKFQDSQAPMEPWYPLPPQDAIDFFNKKVVATLIKSDGGKILITLAARKELKYYDDKAFAITGIIRDDILNDAKQVLLNGLKRGDVPGAVKDLKDVFNKYLDSGIAIDGDLLEPHRLNTIVRTNMMDAINHGRRNMFDDPDLKGFVDFFAYSAIIDDRTTPYCLCMDGKKFRMEDLPMLNPPAHFNCRSIAVPITKFEVKDMTAAGEGVEISDPCPDRMIGFADIRREPINVGIGAIATDDPSKLPFVVPKVVEAPKLDLEPLPKSDIDLALNAKLRQELSQIIVRCPYTICASQQIKMTSTKFNVGEFLCDKCGLPFRVSTKGDLYLYDAGTDTWERSTIGLYPAFFTAIKLQPKQFTELRKTISGGE